VDHFLKPLEHFAIYARGAAPCLKLGDDERSRGAALLAARGAHTAPYVLHPGSGSPRKNWPVLRFIELARLLDARAQCPLFLVGEADHEVADVLRRKAPDIPLLADLDLLDVARVLSAATAYVGNDSGITHLAAALGRPTLALFGPSNPDLWSPRGARLLRAPDGDLGRLSVFDVVGALPP